MPSKRRPTSLLGPLIRHDRNDIPPVPNLPSPFLATPRTRTQSLRSGIDDEVYIFSHSNSSSTTANSPVAASVHAKMTRGLGQEVPSYISSRSANSLISFSRPTRIQAVTLYYLNKILDELLLHILTSAKSLATDRIKSDGILKVLGGQTGSGSGAGAVLAKNAVLEAELELRNYLDGQRKEGGKVPLGLSATSRWDGTTTFPVQKAYEALRIRCQYYSTLGDLEDPSPHSPQDQNIMSAEGRPIATFTPGVAIYVTSLLEYVAEYILQNVGRVIERDNSDEAGISDLRKAMEEDEGTMYWWKKMSTREEVMAREREEMSKGAQGRVGKPWKVPEASEWDEAAGRKKFQRQSLVTASNSAASHLSKVGVTASPSYTDHRGSPSVMSSNGHDSRDSSILASQRIASPVQSSSAYHTDMTSITSSISTDTHLLTRKQSSDKGWFGKKRGSVRTSADMTSTSTNPAVPFKGTVTASDKFDSEEMNTSDDFDSLMMSGQTMKVSLTPNRLRSIEVTKQKAEEEEVDDKRNSRRRPGTLSPLLYRDGEPSSRAALASPSPTIASRFSAAQEELVDIPPRSISRQSSASIVRTAKKGAPPSAYRAISQGGTARLEDDEHLEDNTATRRNRKDVSSRLGSGFNGDASRTQHRNEARDESQQVSNVKDMVEMFNSTPPPLTNGAFASTSGRDSRMSQSALSIASTENGSTSRKSALTSAGGKMRNLFNKRTPSSTASVGANRTDSQDSIAVKMQSPARQVEAGANEPHRSDAQPMTGTTGLAITGAGGTVALDALTKGLLEGHDKATKSTTVPKPVRKQVRAEEAMDSNDISGDYVSEPGVMDAFAVSSGATFHTGNEMNADTPSSAVVGLYQDVRGNSSASELSLNNQQNGRAVPSRKVPWTYSRQSSATSRRLSGAPVPVGIARVGSGGSSSLDHGSNGENAPPSAWSQGQYYTADAINGFDGRATTPSLVATGSPRSPTPSNRPSDTARTLAQLNLKMKGASSVEECRFLLTQALAAAAAAVRNEFDQPPSNGIMRASSALSTGMSAHVRDNDSSLGEPQNDTSGHDDAPSYEKSIHEPTMTQMIASPVPTRLSQYPNNAKTAKGVSRDAPQQATEDVREHRPASVKYRNLMLPMAVGYDINEDLEAPSYKEQSYLVAWLLDGEGETTTEKATRSLRSLHEQVSIASADEAFLSQDSSRRDDETSQKLPKDTQRQSIVDSVVSVYRDAPSESER